MSKTLNASRSDSDHQPVICVEYCGDRTDASFSTETAYCIPKNPVDGRQQAVCFTQNQREEVRDLWGVAGALTAEPGMHNTNYVVYPGVGITSPQNANNPKPGDPCPTLTEDSRNYLVGKIEAGGGTAVPDRSVHGRAGRESTIHCVVRGRHNADAEERTERREYDPGCGVPG